MNLYSLGEWKSEVIPEALHPDDQFLLTQLQSSARLDVDELKNGVRVRAKSWVGVIRFHNFQVQIVPKLVGENLGLIDMLTYSTGVNALKRYNSQRYLSLQKSGSLFDLIVWLLCDACEVILAGGVLFDYEQTEDDLSNLRGRLLITRQFERRFGQVNRLECRFDEHSSNIPENQLLAVGLLKATRFTQDPLIRNRVRRLAAIFSEVCQTDQLDLQAARNTIQYNRVNSHYKDAHNIAWMILDGLGIDDLFRSDLTPSFAFLLDMNHLFEQFLYKYLLDLLGKSKFAINYQYRDRSIIWDLFRNRPYSQVIPDFIISSENSSGKVAIDAKYKLYDDRKVTSDDIAHVFLYAYAYNESSQPTAILIYPTEEGSNQRASMIIRQSRQLNGAKIHILGLHIPQALKEIHERKHGESAQLLTELIVQCLVQKPLLHAA
jgi:5-methylcytosine-specific restriction enzyme subunit McrC